MVESNRLQGVVSARNLLLADPKTPFTVTRLSSMISMMGFIVLMGTVAVSYTHLDVYKRQPLPR